MQSNMSVYVHMVRRIEFGQNHKSSVGLHALLKFICWLSKT